MRVEESDCGSSQMNALGVKELLRADGLPTEPGHERRPHTPHHQRLERHHGIVKLLLATGANVNQASNSGATPLLAGSQQGHKEVVKLLLAHGAKVNQAENNGNTPLTASSLSGHEDVAKLLLAHGANCELVEWPKEARNGKLPLLTLSLHPPLVFLTSSSYYIW